MNESLGEWAENALEQEKRAVTPIEVAAFITQEQQGHIDSECKKINDELKRDWHEDRTSLKICRNYVITDGKVKRAVIKYFEAAGWDIVANGQYWELRDSNDVPF